MPGRIRTSAFQSTPPVKAATPILVSISNMSLISIHAAREGGDCVAFVLLPKAAISIHAAREGGDALPVAVADRMLYFNPRRP